MSARTTGRPARTSRSPRLLLGSMLIAATLLGGCGQQPENLIASPGEAARVASTAPANTSSEGTHGTPAADAAAPAPGANGGTPAGCTTAPGEIANPSRFIVERMGVDSKMIVVGEDAAGNPGAPPPGEAETTAWYDGSPAIGSEKGNVILTIHTYQQKFGPALGNRLYGEGGLRPGDLIRIVDADGKQACYRYRENTKVWVASYDPNSNVFHDANGRPQLAIMICWDYDEKIQDWASRIIFYADYLPQGQPG